MKMVNGFLVLALSLSGLMAKDNREWCQSNLEGCYVNEQFKSVYGTKEHNSLIASEGDASLVIPNEIRMVAATPDFPMYLEPLLSKIAMDADPGRTGLEGIYEAYMSTRFKNCVLWTGNIGQVMINCNDMVVGGEEVTYVVYRPADIPLDPEVVEATKSEINTLARMLRSAGEGLYLAQDSDGCKVVSRSASTAIEIVDCWGEKMVNVPLEQWANDEVVPVPAAAPVINQMSVIEQAPVVEQTVEPIQTMQSVQLEKSVKQTNTKNTTASKNVEPGKATNTDNHMYVMINGIRVHRNNMIKPGTTLEKRIEFLESTALINEIPASDYTANLYTKGEISTDEYYEYLISILCSRDYGLEECGLPKYKELIANTKKFNHNMQNNTKVQFLGVD